MDLGELRHLLLSKPGGTEDTPFGPDALVYKVKGKMYALVSWKSSPLRLNLKCDPMHALSLRQQYAAVEPGYHMNKRHWNTLVLDGTVPLDEVHAMIAHSYDLVVKGLTKAQQRELARETKTGPRQT